MKTSHKTARQTFFQQIARYVLIGGVASTINFFVFMYWVEWHHMHPPLANLIGFLCGFCFSFLGHSSWTFSDYRGSKHTALKLFLCANILNLCVNQLLFFSLYHMTTWQPHTIVVVVIALTTMMTYSLNRCWVFKRSM